jgi:hypothetical protein
MSPKFSKSTKHGKVNWLSCATLLAILNQIDYWLSVLDGFKAENW